jgi:hypothetical protein
MITQQQEKDLIELLSKSDKLINLSEKSTAIQANMAGNLVGIGALDGALAEDEDLTILNRKDGDFGVRLKDLMAVSGVNSGFSVSYPNHIVSANVGTYFTNGSVNFDFGSEYQGQNNRFVAKFSGTYFILASCDVGANFDKPNSQIQLMLEKNGGLYKNSVFFVTEQDYEIFSYNQTVHNAQVINLKAGDDIRTVFSTSLSGTYCTKKILSGVLLQKG